MFDFGNDTLLNDESYLYNVDDSINVDECFVNIIDAYSCDEALYQVPLNAYVVGLNIDESLLSDSQYGFTYEEYAEFIADYAGGADPILGWADREWYWNQMMSYLYFDTHTEDGLLDIDNAAFRESMEYAQNIPQEFADLYVPKMSVRELRNFGAELDAHCIKANYRLLGFPSYEAKTPMCRMENSIAITSCTVSEDASLSFLQLSLSYDVQVESTRYNPINVNAFESVARRELTRANNLIEQERGINDYYTEDLISYYEDCLKSAQVGAISDPITINIIFEEIDAYFQGQKTLDDVIPIIEDRVNNMIAERT